VPRTHAGGIIEGAAGPVGKSGPGRRRLEITVLAIISGSRMVHSLDMGPVEIFLVIVAVAVVAYVVWRLVIRPRR
jgi:hypothetical protein